MNNGDESWFMVGFSVGAVIAFSVTLYFFTQDDKVKSAKPFRIENATYKCEKINELKY